MMNDASDGRNGVIRDRVYAKALMLIVCGLSIGDTSPTLQTEKVPAVWPA